MASRTYGVEGVGTKNTYAIVSGGICTNVVIADAAWATAQATSGETLYLMPVTPGTPGIGASQATIAAAGSGVSPS